MITKDDLIGIPDPWILAEDLRSNGHTSCADAERAGWQMTQHEATRVAVDALLKEWGPKPANEASDESKA